MKLTKESKQLIDKLIENRLKQKLNEAQSIDIAYAVKDLDSYNRGQSKLKNTTYNIVKNLGYKPTTKNLENTEYHLQASLNDDEKFNRRDLYGIIRDLYKILK